MSGSDDDLGAAAASAAPAPPRVNDDGAVDTVPNGPFEWLTNFNALRNLLDPAFLFPPSSTGPEDADCATTTSGNDDEVAAVGGGRPPRRRRVLNVGCGTSTIGESLVEHLGYDEVINADVDAEALDTMGRRWNARLAARERGEDDDEAQQKGRCGTMKFVHLDFSSESREAEYDEILSGPFDVVLDKSTLDCALCSEDAASGLLCRAYRSLRAPSEAVNGDDDRDTGNGDGGVYVVVSFHPKEFILPLLSECPGAKWDVEHVVVGREVDIPEHLVGRPGFASRSKETDRQENGEDEKRKEGITSAAPTPESNSVSEPVTSAAALPASAWRDGTFSPDDAYRRTASVFLCRLRRRGDTSLGDDGRRLNRDAVREHVHRTNDAWFQVHNPMVTHAREEDLRKSFRKKVAELQDGPADELSDGERRLLPLSACYEILFTDAEREHLEYDHFLEDWEAFVDGASNRGGDKDGMTVDVALRFLEEMQ